MTWSSLIEFFYHDLRIKRAILITGFKLLTEKEHILEQITRCLDTESDLGLQEPATTTDHH